MPIRRKKCDFYLIEPLGRVNAIETRKIGVESRDCHDLELELAVVMC
jgi:hypothetical protein